MKDAKGHGSDGHGGGQLAAVMQRNPGYGNLQAKADAAKADAAHQAGVSQIGQESPTSRELRMFADNNADLHRQSQVPIQNNLDKKAAKGIYDPTKATKLWGYHADRAAQAYTKQFGSSGDKWHQMFPPAVRREAAANWERANRK